MTLEFILRRRADNAHPHLGGADWDSASSDLSSWRRFESCPPGCTNTSNTYLYAREIVAQIFNVYALRMAAVFLISQATLWMRTGVMPRWMALLTYLVALVLLFVVTQASSVILVFPGWVFLVSVFILVTHLTGPRQAARAPLRRDESES